MPDTKLTGLSEVSAPALSDVFYWVEAPGSAPVSDKITGARAAGLLAHTPVLGRLTTETGVPVSTSDRTAQGTLFLTPSTPWGMSITTGYVRTYDGTRIRMQEYSEVSLALTVTSGSNYDVFLKNSDLSLVLSAAWTNGTTRADALAKVKDLIVAATDNTLLWLGTIRASGANTVEDSFGYVTTQVGGKRFVWNAWNQVLKAIGVKDTANTWSYSTATLRGANGAVAPLNCVEWVTGNAASLVSAQLNAGGFGQSNSARASAAGIGIDTQTAWSGFYDERYNPTASTITIPFQARYRGYPGLGYHYASWGESGGDGTNTWYGDNGGTTQQSGLTADLMG